MTQVHAENGRAGPAAAAPGATWVPDPSSAPAVIDLRASLPGGPGAGSTLSTAVQEACQRWDAHTSRTDWTDLSPMKLAILETFLGLAARHGWSSVTMRMLGQAMSVKAPSLYAHFPGGRREVVIQSLSWSAHRFARAVLSSLAGATTADDAWETLVRIHLRRQLALPESDLWDLIVATDAQVGGLPDAARATAQGHVACYEDLLTAVVVQLGVPDPSSLVRLVLTLLEGAGRWNDWSGAPEDLKHLEDRAVAVCGWVLAQARSNGH
ncbi:TetR/AcrR family transcriptional regulator [Kineococcus aurantiacus]|uniref:TetR/AcrR family transcriptional regulator n=1 Tax=Kineococcus aurantiacus TaxID=37633 RepID=UPI0015CB7586